MVDKEEKFQFNVKYKNNEYKCDSITRSNQSPNTVIRCKSISDPIIIEGSTRNWWFHRPLKERKLTTENIHIRLHNDIAIWDFEIFRNYWPNETSEQHIKQDVKNILEDLQQNKIR